MRGLRTPCIQAFLHMLPALGLLWALVDVAPLTASLVKGMAPSAAVSAIQVCLTTFLIIQLCAPNGMCLRQWSLLISNNAVLPHIVTFGKTLVGSGN